MSSSCHAVRYAGLGITVDTLDELPGLGNDALWNAESQIQLREYGRERMHGCDLTPARYDLAVAALGGHGEYVERAEDLPSAIERSLGSGKPACINIQTESIAAPVIRL